MKQWILSHKKLAILLTLVLIGGGYGVVRAMSKDDAETRYVLAAVERGTVISSVSGSGQVSSSNEVELSPEASGELTSVNVKAGQQVAAGTVIARIDASDAVYALENAQLPYSKLFDVDENDIRKAENAVIEAKEDLEDSYTNARTSLIAQSTEMTDTLEEVDTLFDGYLSPSKQGRSKMEKELIDKAESSYYAADDLLDDYAKKYRTISNGTDEKTIESMVADAHKIATAVAQTAKYTQDAVIYLRNREDNDITTANDAYATLNTLANTANTIVSTLASAKNGIVNAERALENSEVDLTVLKEGPDELDIQPEELPLRQKQQALSDYTVHAPFAGVIASVDAVRGDSVNGGTTIATLITKEKIAEISLNEVDAAKVSVGHKATVTFDALEELSITGTVAEIDLIGTVTQGVVNYTVKIGFDTADDRVKPGMTANATIITDTAVDVLNVPASAIKTQGDISYLETLKNAEIDAQSVQGIASSETPEQIQVVTGLVSDEFVEIVSGLDEGDMYIARTIRQSTTTASSASAPSLFGGAGGGGNMRRGATGGFGGGTQTR